MHNAKRKSFRNVLNHFRPLGSGPGGQRHVGLLPRPGSEPRSEAAAAASNSRSTTTCYEIPSGNGRAFCTFCKPAEAGLQFRLRIRNSTITLRFQASHPGRGVKGLMEGGGGKIKQKGQTNPKGLRRKKLLSSASVEARNYIINLVSKVSHKHKDFEGKAMNAILAQQRLSPRSRNHQRPPRLSNKSIALLYLRSTPPQVNCCRHELLNELKGLPEQTAINRQ